jgi:hypothetical protein
MSTIRFNVNICQLNQYDITWTRYGAPWSASLSGGATHQGLANHGTMDSPGELRGATLW